MSISYTIPPVPEVRTGHTLNDIFDNDSFGNATLSGINMTQEMALQLAPYWEAIDMISGDIAKLPFKTYKRIPGTDNGRAVAVNAPSTRLLTRSPNDDMTPFKWKKAMMFDAVQGNGYSFVPRDLAGNPSALIKLDPFSTTAVKITSKSTGNVELWYYTTTSSGQQIWMRESEVIHFSGLSADGITGFSVWNNARQSLGIAYSSQAYGAKFFANDASGGVVLSSPKPMNDVAKENLRRSWENMHKGQDNFHRTIVLEDGIEPKQMKINAKDAQLLETRKFSIREIAGWFRMPPHKLGDDARTSYSSLEQENQSYLDSCLDHWLVMMEEELTRKLLTPAQRASGSVFIEANRNVLLRVDSTTKWTTYNSAVNNGIMSRNEIRALENLNPVKGLDGYTIPVNLSDVTNASEEEGTQGSIDDIGNDDDKPDEETPLDTELEDDDAADGEDDNASRAMMGVTLDRIVKRWTSMMTRTMNSKKHKSPEKAFEAFNNDLSKSKLGLHDELEPFCRAAKMDTYVVGINLVEIFHRYEKENHGNDPDVLADLLNRHVGKMTLESLGDK